MAKWVRQVYLPRPWYMLFRLARLEHLKCLKWSLLDGSCFTSYHFHLLLILSFSWAVFLKKLLFFITTTMNSFTF